MLKDQKAGQHGWRDVRRSDRSKPDHGEEFGFILCAMGNLRECFCFEKTIQVTVRRYISGSKEKYQEETTAVIHHGQWWFGLGVAVSGMETRGQT